MSLPENRTRDLLARSVRLAEGILEGCDQPGEDFAWVAFHHLSVACRDAKGVLELCRSGLSDVALLLVRRLWENTIRLEYIRANPDDRVRAFLEEAWVEEYRTWSKARRRAEEGTASPIAQALLSDPRAAAKYQLLELLRQRVSDEARRRTQGFSPLWKVRDMAKDLGVEEQYEFLYSFLSQRGHVGADMVKDYWIEKAPGSFHRQMFDYSTMAIGLACAWLLHILDVYTERYAPEHVETISGMLKELSAGAG